MREQRIPSQDLIKCKNCGASTWPHKKWLTLCKPCVLRKQVEYTRKHREKLRQQPKQITCCGCGVQFIKTNPKSSRCPPCQAAWKLDYVNRHKAQGAEASRRYRQSLGDEYRRKTAQRRKDRMSEMTPEELANFRACERAKTKRLIAKLKDEAFVAYGGWRCACCGESERLFLSIDHIDGNGRKMREIHGQTGMFYRWLKKCGYPPGFQILCINCNFGKHQNGGVCPHQVRRNDYPEREYSQAAGSAVPLARG